jgi:multiple sugar transport system ATP-binding protein
MASVTIRSVSKYYSQVEAMKNLSINIENGDFVTLVGPSGCGKSTLLRMIAGIPKVFLFDEPLSNLDTKLRVQMRSEIKDPHRRLGTTTIYVTHDQVEAMTMADKIVVMRSGAIEQIGTPLEVYDRPQTLFVADFIGSPSMNFIEGTLTQYGFRTPDNLLIPFANKDLPSKDVPAAYGIRPEHLMLSENGIPAKVLVVEPTGSETQVVVKVGGQ